MNELKTVMIEQVFAAPIEQVWHAWTTADEIKKWWGPLGFTAPTVQIDFREGGTFLYGMSSPDYENGKEIFGVGIFKEIVPLQRIVYTDSFADEKGNAVSASYYDMGDDFPEELLIIVEFEETENGNTKLTLQHDGMPGDQADDAEQGWRESFEKLAASLL